MNYKILSVFLILLLLSNVGAWRIDTLDSLKSISSGIENNLLVFYPMTSATSNNLTTLDLSGNGYNGSVTNFPYNSENQTYSNNNRSGAHWINVTNVLNVTNNFTLLVLARLESSESFGYLFGTNASWGTVTLLTETSGKTTGRIGINGTFYNSSSGYTSPGLNKYIWVAMTKDSTTFKLYEDGVLVATNYYANNSVGKPYLFIGGNPGDSTRAFNGSIMTAAIWTRPLSATELLAIDTYGDGYERVDSQALNCRSGTDALMAFAGWFVTIALLLAVAVVLLGLQGFFGDHFFDFNNIMNWSLALLVATLILGAMAVVMSSPGLGC